MRDAARTVSYKSQQHKFMNKSSGFTQINIPAAALSGYMLSQNFIPATNIALVRDLKAGKTGNVFPILGRLHPHPQH